MTLSLRLHFADNTLKVRRLSYSSDELAIDNKPNRLEVKRIEKLLISCQELREQFRCFK